MERSHQVHDLPEIAVKVTQHEVWQVRCGCGREHVGVLVTIPPASTGAERLTLGEFLVGNCGRAEPLAG